MKSINYLGTPPVLHFKDEEIIPHIAKREGLLDIAGHDDRAAKHHFALFQ